MKQGESENWQLHSEPLVFRYQNVCCVQKHELLRSLWKEKNEVIVKGATSLNLLTDYGTIHLQKNTEGIF